LRKKRKKSWFKYFQPKKHTLGARRKKKNDPPPQEEHEAWWFPFGKKDTPACFLGSKEKKGEAGRGATFSRKAHHRTKNRGGGFVALEGKKKGGGLTKK